MSKTPFPQKSLLPHILREFMKTESSGGVVMLLFAALALIAANSPLSEWYESFIRIPVTLGYKDFIATEPLNVWVKDILMVFFFLVVGMELKREMREGFLSKRDQMVFPLLAAVGGMAAPTAVFFTLNHAYPANLVGWAIPSATDIAFALCILTLVGKDIPPAVKVFLLAIAIFDDLGAILVIAAFYNTVFSVNLLAMAIIGIGMLVLLNRRNITSLTPYILTGIYLWLCLHRSGIHTTIVGVMVGMAIPMRDKKQPLHSPLNHAMHILHPWVSFLVLPVFSFTSAGVSFSGIRLTEILEPLPLGIALGLFFGKQIGIFGTTWLLIKLQFVSKPEATGWTHLYGVSTIAGIGFTMSLFIGLLAFNDTGTQEMVKIGVISGSLLSSIWGFIILRYSTLKKAKL